MTTTMKALKSHEHIEKVIIHSLDQALYQVSVMLDGEEHYVTDNHGQLIRSHNMLSILVFFEDLPVKETILRHQSAYDEMIGLTPGYGNNQLEVPIGSNRLGFKLAADEPKNIH